MLDLRTLEKQTKYSFKKIPLLQINKKTKSRLKKTIGGKVKHIITTCNLCEDVCGVQLVRGHLV